MKRSWLFAVASLVSGTAGFIGVGCSECTLGYQALPVELGIDVDLHEVAFVGEQFDERYYSNVAVGAEGTIAVWGQLDSGDPEWFVEIAKHGDADLRAVWVVPYFQDDYGSTTWWIVGDAGTVASSDDYGSTWEAIELPNVSADLHAITDFAARPLIVGDETVIFGQSDGTFSTPPTPEGGWGALRGVHTNGELTYAVGLGGRVWSTTQAAGPWEAETTNVQVDLFDVHVGETKAIVVGAEGTVLIEDVSGWRQIDTGVSVDLIDISEYPLVLGADGTVYDLDRDEQFVLIENRPPAARALAHHISGFTTVGAGGYAASPEGWDCP